MTRNDETSEFWQEYSSWGCPRYLRIDESNIYLQGDRTKMKPRLRYGLENGYKPTGNKGGRRSVAGAARDSHGRFEKDKKW